jgi:hypothetical protein
MTRALDVIEDYLEWRGLSFLRLDGDTSSAERGELVAEFNDPASDVFILLLSMRAGGVGLNLQAADTVIIYDHVFPHFYASLHRCLSKSCQNPSMDMYIKSILFGRVTAQM